MTFHLTADGHVQGAVRLGQGQSRLGSQVVSLSGRSLPRTGGQVTGTALPPRPLAGNGLFERAVTLKTPQMVKFTLERMAKTELKLQLVGESTAYRCNSFTTDEK
jgi:hypothetical protein